MILSGPRISRFYSYTRIPFTFAYEYHCFHYSMLTGLPAFAFLIFAYHLDYIDDNSVFFMPTTSITDKYIASFLNSHFTDYKSKRICIVRFCLFACLEVKKHYKRVMFIQMSVCPDVCSL